MKIAPPDLPNRANMNKDSIRSWMVIVLLGIALTISQMDRMLLSIAAPKLMAEQNISGTALGFLLSSFAWTYMAFQLPSGWLVDRFGPKRIMAIAFLFWSLACVLTGFASTLATLMTCMLLLGAFEAPFYPVAHSTMASVFTDRRRALATAIYTKGASLGPALGAIVGTFLLVNYGRSNMFIIWGTVSLAFLIPWMLVVPSSIGAGRSETKENQWPVMMALLKSRAVWGLSLGYFGFLYLYFIYITWLPTYLTRSRGLSTTQVAWMTSVPFLLSLVTGPLAGLVVDWLICKGYSQNVVRKVGIGVGLFLGSAIIPAAFVHDVRVAAILFVVALAGQSISAVNMLSLPSAIAPKGHAGFVGACQQMLGIMGGIVSPILTGVLYDRTHDFKPAIICAGLMLVLAAVSFLVILPKIEPIKLPGKQDASADSNVIALQNASAIFEKREVR